MFNNLIINYVYPFKVLKDGGPTKTIKLPWPLQYTAFFLQYPFHILEYLNSTPYFHGGLS